MPYQVFILDDHPAIARGLEMELKNDSFQITSGYHPSALIQSLNNGNIEALILDYELKEGTVLDIIPMIRKVQPGLPILIYTMHSEPWILSLLIKQEVNGIVNKSDRIDEIEKALRSILVEHEIYYSPTARNTIASIIGDQSAKRNMGYTPSPREREIINLLSHGFTSEDISQKACLSKNTIDTMRKNILLKSGALNVSHLMRIAFLKGWING